MFRCQPLERILIEEVLQIHGISKTRGVSPFGLKELTCDSRDGASLSPKNACRGPWSSMPLQTSTLTTSTWSRRHPAP